MTNLQQTIGNAPQEILNTNSQKISILLWTNQNPKNSFILKKDGKRYLGLVRKDKKGQDYWKFKEMGEKKEPNNPNDSPVMDKVEKFNQRQAKVQEYANNSNSQK